MIAIPSRIGSAAASPRIARTDREAAAAPPVVAEASAAAAPDNAYVWVGIFLLLAGALTGAFLDARHWYTFTPKPGVTTFASFYVFAQALERLAELMSLIWPGAGGTRPPGKPAITKRAATELRDRALARAMSDVTKDAVQAAADAQTSLDRIRLNRAVLAWTFTSALAMAAAGLLGLKLIASISSTPASPVWLDLVITGLAIGGGTKPLHDLIASLQESRKTKQDPSGVAGK